MVVDYYPHLIIEGTDYLEIDESPLLTKESPITILTSAATDPGSTFPSTTTDLHTSVAATLTVDDDGKGEEGRDTTVSILLLIIFVIGMIGNFIVIFVILVLAEYKKVSTHWYVLHLAMADIIFLATIPLRVTEGLHSKWIFSQWACKAKETMFFLSYYASASFLSLMAIDRYIITCHRFSQKSQKFRTRSVACITTVLVWIISTLFCIPAIIFSSKAGTPPSCRCEFLAADTFEIAEICLRSGYQRETPEFARCIDKFSSESDRKCGANSFLKMNATFSNLPTDFQNPSCHYNRRSTIFKGIAYFNFVVMFIIPFTIVTVCYTFIALQLRRSPGKSDPITQNPVTRKPAIVKLPECRMRRANFITSTRGSQNQNGVTRICVCLTVLFLCCWLPFHMVHFAKMKGIEADERYCEELFHIIFIIVYFSVSCHSALNPYMYLYIGRKSKLRSVHKSMRKRPSSSSLEVKYRASNHYRSSEDAGCELNLAGYEVDSKETLHEIRHMENQTTKLKDDA